MYKLYLKIPWLPASTNVQLRTNRYAANRKNKAWDAYIWAETRGKAPPAPLPRATLVITRHAHRMLDYDGLVGSLKPVADALVYSGIIVDDRWSVLGPWAVGQAYRPAELGGLLEILIEEVL